MENFTQATTFTQVGSKIKPEDWTYAGHYTYFSYPDGEDGYEIEYDIDINFEMIGITNPEKWLSNFNPNDARCSCCNHKIKRGMFFIEKETSILIYVGFNCGDNILKYTFNIKGAKNQTMIQRKKRILQIKIVNALESNEGLEDLLGVNDRIIRDIATKFYKTGIISEKQIEFIKKLAQKRKELESVSTEITEGRFKDLFKVISCKEYYDEWSKTKSFKMLIQNSKGHWKAFGNVGMMIEPGTELTLTATFSKSDKDPFFGFFKRLNLLGFENLQNQ